MYFRRPLCVYASLFALILAGLAAVSGPGGSKDTGRASFTGTELMVTGTVENIEYKNDRSLIHLKNVSFANENISDRIIVYPTDLNITDQLHIGQRIRVKGELNDYRSAMNRGEFDMKEYYEIKHCDHVIYNGTVTGVSSSYDHLRDTLYRVRTRTESIYEKYLDERYGGIVNALVLADRNGLLDDVREQYKNAGISHILALSGLHIVTMGFMIYGLLKRMRLPYYISAFISVILIMMYCLMTGMPTSALRALIMYILSMCAVLLGRTSDLRTSASIAAVIMLVTDPLRLTDPAFLLSFSAVIGIGLVYPSVRGLVMNSIGKKKIKGLHRSRKRPVRYVMKLLRSLVFSLSIQLAIVPVTMWFYYQLPTYGIFANLIVIPLSGVLLLCSVLTGVSGNMYLLFPIKPFDLICRAAAFMTSGILKLYDLVSLRVNKLPGGLMITGRPLLWQLILYYILLLSVVFCGYALQTAGNRSAEYIRKRSVMLLSLCIVAAAMLFIRIEPALEISSLYVGQGQCFVIHGSRVPTVMYDCGSTDKEEVARYTVIPFLKYLGIDRVDTIFVSHFDKDHVSGVTELLKSEGSGISVGKVLIPSTSSREKSDNFDLLINAAKDACVPVYKMCEGDRIGWKHLKAYCLMPEAGRSFGDQNEDSMVIGLESEDGLSVLFTGDISSEVEDRLIEKRIGRYDYLQVAHHGSRSAANKDFIKAVSPKMAVISAGINNRYGHPHEETLEMLKEQEGLSLFVTSEKGETDLTMKDGSFFVSCPFEKKKYPGINDHEINADIINGK